jgi:alpha-1,6-mannosyltransferase
MARLIGGSDGASTARGRWAERNARAYLADLYARFDLVRAPSRSRTRQLHDWGVWQAVRQPLGVDCSVFSPRAYDASWRARLEQQLGLAHGVRLFVYVGSFGADKNLAMLADAVQRLGPAHALLAVGSGPCPPVGAHVRLLPAQDDPQSLARLLASCDVFVHAGDHETFGLSALEAMACGTPLVVSHAGGHSELVEGAALTVSSRSAEQWAEAMAATLADPHSSLSWTALERARAYDWPQIVVQLAGRYRQAIRAVRPVEQSRATLMPAA